MSPIRRAIPFSVIFSILCFGQALAQVRLSSDAAENLVIEKPEAIYPPIAKSARAEGIVKVAATVSEHGLVTSVIAISGHPLLHHAAVTAVKKRKYRAHLINDKPVSFITDVYISFPPGVLTAAQKQKYEQQEQLATQLYEKDPKCRDLARAQKWKEAEEPCRIIVRIADQLSENRAMERMRAYEVFGHVLRGQERRQEALEYYNLALDAVRSRLTERDAELARLYGDLAIIHHLLRDLGKARELYQKAEKIYQTAHASIGDGASDEWIDRTKEGYMKSLKQLLEYHLIAAEDAGVTSEVEEIQKLMKSLP